MRVHEAIEATPSRSAAFADAWELAEGMYPIAASRGLTHFVLVCAEQRALHHEPIIERLSRRAARAANEVRGRGGDPAKDADVQRLLRGLLRSNARRKAGQRFRKPSLGVHAASRELIHLVQSYLREEYDDSDLRGEPLPSALAGELRGLQWHAFDALWTPRRGHADAKRLQLELVDEPLAICENCDRIFPDNVTVAGRSKITRLCRERCAHARRQIPR